MVVVLEVLFVRPFLKVGWGFLQMGPVPSLYEILTTLGPFTLNSSLLLALISAGLAGYILTIDRSLLNSVTSTFLFGFLIFGVLSFFTTPKVESLMVQNMAAIIVITLLALRFTKDGASKMMKVVTVLFITSYFCAFWFGVAPVLFALGGPKPTFMVEILNIGEALAIMNALPLYILFVGIRKEKFSWDSKLILPSIPAALFVGVYLVNPALTSLFSTWVLGYTLFLPFPLYAAAIWLYSDTIIRMLKVNKEIAYGLLFIFLAGRNLESVYLTLLTILGIFLLIHHVHLENKESRKIALPYGLRYQRISCLMIRSPSLRTPQNSMFHIHKIALPYVHAHPSLQRIPVFNGGHLHLLYRHTVNLIIVSSNKNPFYVLK